MEDIIKIAEITSKTLVIFGLIENTKPLTNKIIPSSKIKLLGIIPKTPNTQNIIAINMSKIPNTLIIIFYLELKSF